MVDPMEKQAIYPNLENFWTYSNSGYFNGLIAHNLAIIAGVMQEQQKTNARNAVLLKQVDDSLKSIRKTLNELNKRRVVVHRD